MKNILPVVLVLVVINNLWAQKEEAPTIRKMEGIWHFQDRNFISYMYNKSNKSIKITYWSDDKEASIFGNPYSYFGFWNVIKEAIPKKITDLDSTGLSIYFYDFLGRDYDTLGNIVGPARTLWVTYNEDEEPTHEPAILRFYRTGTPNVYIRVKSIPDSILLTLKKNSRDWSRYATFVGMRRIKVPQAILHKSPGVATKAYLIKGDEVEVLQRQKGWVQVKYYGPVVNTGWLKADTIE